MNETGKTLQNTSEEQKGPRRRGNPQNLTNAGKGRKIGTKNKLTQSAQETIQKAFKGLGGEEALIEWANKNDKNKGAFYTLIWSKIIPKNIDLKADITHDIASRLLEARKRQALIEGQRKEKLEFNDTGRLITEKIMIEGSVIEELEAEENE